VRQRPKKAKESDEMSDLIAETEEAMRRERLEKIWHDHKHKIIAAISALILGTASISAHDHWNQSQNVKSTNAMLTLTEAENFPDNITPDTKLDMRAGIKGLLLIQTANAHLSKETPDTAAAIDIYTQITQDNALDQDIRDLALISKTRLEGNEGSPDIAALIKQLEPILNRKSSAYKPTAIIESAALHAKLSDYDAALGLLEQIKDTPGLTETLYLKTQSLSHIYKIKQGAQTNETQ